MYFEGRALKPYAEYVKPAELVVGRVYFKVSYLDNDGFVPELVPLVFIGRDLNPKLLGLYFQDAASYLGGDRFSSVHWVPAFEDESYRMGAFGARTVSSNGKGSAITPASMSLRGR